MREGIYTGIVVEHRFRFSQTGTMAVDVLFQLEGTENETIWASIWLTENSVKIARKSLRAIGHDVDHDSLEALETDQHKLAGRKAELDIQSEEYKGQETLKVKWINPINADRPKDFQSKVKKFDSLLRSAKKANVEEAELKDDGPTGDQIPF